MQAIELLARLLVGQVFLVSGLGKLLGYSGALAYLDGSGIPGNLLPLVIAIEIGAGLALIAGWQTRWAAFLLAGFTILAALLFADRMPVVGFQKDLAISGALMLWLIHGAGEWSLDRRRRPKKGMFA